MYIYTNTHKYIHTHIFIYAHIYIHKRACDVNVVGKWIRQIVFKPWTRLIAFHIALIPLGNGCI